MSEAARKPATGPDILLQQVAIIEIGINQLIVSRVAADDDVAFEIVNESMVERLNAPERRKILNKILEVDAERRRQAGLSDDDLSQFIDDLGSVFSLRNKIAHAATVEWIPQHEEQGPGWRMLGVKQGKPMKEFHPEQELLALIFRADELMKTLGQIVTQYKRAAALRRAAQRRLVENAAERAERRLTG